METKTYDLGGEAYAEARDDGSIIVGTRKGGSVLLDADQLATLRDALDRADEAADDFGL